MELSIENQDKIANLAEKEFPKECCGIIVSINGHNTVIPCINRSLTPEDSFAISENDIKDYPLDSIIAFYHSHKENDEFSIADIAFSEKLNKKSIIYICRTKQFKQYEPHGAKIPYIGRQFFPGVLDCYTLLQDFYRQELNIKLNNIEHINRDMYNSWRDSKMIDEQLKNSSLVSSMLNNGFNETRTLRKYDVVLLRLIDIPYPIHTAIYLGDNKILHHLEELSTIESYRNVYKRLTVKILRHKELS